MNIEQNPKIGIVSLGCPKALVDSERILTKLRSQGYEIAPDYQGAGAVIVNTCGFLDSAKAESLEAIGEALSENGKVIVTGCLGKDEALIRENYPNVLEISGPHQYERVVEAVNTHVPRTHNAFTDLLPPEGLRLTPRHYAYLKISEGCNNRCSFCIIPQIRGDLVSRPIHHVLMEAEHLAKAGVKEIMVISQDTSAYGVDVKYESHKWHDKDYQTRFYDLAKGLGELGIWIRMQYVYPYPHVDKVVELMAEGHILPYLDIPFQHAAPNVLKSMKRPANQVKTEERIKKWREICPEITLRSTFIVGYPGETEEDFQYLLDWLTEVKLDRVGCFKYEAVDGAPANALPNAVPEEIKEVRWHRFMQHQQAISEQSLLKKLGSITEVIIDEIDYENNVAIARSKADAPEIDGNVFLEDETNFHPGDIVKVKITNSDEYDLWAEVY